MPSATRMPVALGPLPSCLDWKKTESPLVRDEIARQVGDMEKTLNKTSCKRLLPRQTTMKPFPLQSGRGCRARSAGAG